MIPRLLGLAYAALWLAIPVAGAASGAPTRRDASKEAVAAPTDSFTIAVVSSGPGSVTPSGAVRVARGDSLAFAFLPVGCAVVTDVQVDGLPIAPASGYTFTDVQSNHALGVNFGPAPTTTILRAVGTCLVPDTLTATISGAEGGYVSVYDSLSAVRGLMYLGIGYVVSGVATLVVKPPLSAGPHSLLAIYAGTSCAATSRASLDFVVQAVEDSASVRIAAFPKLLKPGEYVTASIAIVIGNVVVDWAGGSVAFYDNGVRASGDHSVVFGRVYAQITLTRPGYHTITARYSGIGCILPSISDSVTVRVASFPGELKITSSPNPVYPGQAVVLTAKIYPTTATGTIEFKDVSAGKSLGTVPVVAGSATLASSFATLGDHIIEASYSGDASTLPAVEQLILMVAAQVTVSFPNGGVTLVVGRPAALTWTHLEPVAARSVTVAVSRDSGKTWETLARDIPDRGAYPWTVTPPATNSGSARVYSALIRVTATDTAGVSGSDQSEAPFAIYAAPVCTTPPVSELTSAAAPQERQRGRYTDPPGDPDDHLLRARWRAGGIPIATGPADQTTPVLAADGSGGMFVAWAQHDPSAGAMGEIFAARLTRVGDVAPGWQPNGTPVVSSTGYPVRLRIMADGTGGVLVVWQDLSTYQVHVQRLTGAGAVASCWPVRGIVVGDFSAIVPDGLGGFYVPYRNYRTYCSPENLCDFYSQVFLERVDAVGSFVDTTGIAWVVNSIDQVAAAADGWSGAYVAYLAAGAIYGVHVGLGTAPWSRYLMFTAGTYDPLSVIADANNGFLVSQAVGFYYGKGTILALHGGSDGTLAPGWPDAGVALQPLEFQKNGPVPTTLPDGSGGYLFVWSDARAGAPGAYAVRLTASGSVAPGWVSNGNRVPSAQYSSACEDGAGGAYVVWSAGPAGNADIYAQRIGGGGSLSTGWDPNGHRVCAALGDQLGPQCISDGAGGAFVVWEDHRNGNADIYVTRILATPVAVTFDVEPQTLNPREKGRWVTGFLEPPAPFTADQIDVGSVRLNSLVPADTAASKVMRDRDRNDDDVPELMVKFEREAVERTVTPSGVVAVTGLVDGLPFVGSDTIRVCRARDDAAPDSVLALAVRPALFVLALRGATPNPAARHFHVSFTLADGRAASLALYDVSGRLVARREVGGLGPGLHAIDLEARTLPAGMYLIALSHGGGLSSRGV